MRPDVYSNAKPDQTLKQNLTALFGKVKIPDSSKEMLVDRIILKINWREDSEKYSTSSLSVAEHFEKVNTYISSLYSVRKAWLALPLKTKELLPEMIPEITSSLLDTTLLSSKFYDDKGSLPEWRQIGLSDLESWGSDLEMIDLMIATAEHWKNAYLVKFKRRNSSHIGLIAGIAESCIEYGIKVSHTPRSHFVQILMLVFPDLGSPKAAVKEAIEILKRSNRKIF